MLHHSSQVPLALAGRYAVDREVGRGGMATVYVADDLRHKRRVAVKILHESIASSVGVDRFLREIEIAAKLAHPHILPLFDSGEADGTIFCVVPYVDGSTLRERLIRDGRLSLVDAVGIARALSGALDYAHRQGVVHRDVKPENILFQDGQPLLADFGIALALDAAADARLTRAGVSLGTPAYMSPEQSFGEDIDGRADQYALASVLAEMLIGDPPFGNGSSHSIIGRRFSSIAPRLRAVDSTVPEAIDIAVARALSRAPDERFATMAEFARALGTGNMPTLGATSTQAEETEPSILVLPFTNLSQDADNAYFADGLSEELMTGLSKVRSLRVISRSSAMSLKGTQKDAARVGRELAVRYVLEGSVRRAGNNVRITAQLTDVATARSLWGDAYTGALDDVFAIQESLSRRIIEALEVRLTPEESRRIWDRSPTDVSAWEWYQQARQEMWHTTPAALQRAERLITRGLEVTGGSLVLEALHGVVSALYLTYYLSTDESRYARAEACARKVLGERPDLPYGHVIQALVLYRRGLMRDSASAFARALKADPTDPDSLMWLARHYIWAGKPEAAKPLLDRLRAVDPLTPKNRHAYGYYEAVAGRFESAAAIFREWMDLDYENPVARWWLAHVLARAGRVGEAIAIVDMSDEVCVGNPGVRQSMQFLKHALLGQRAAADAALMVLTQTGLQMARDDETMPWFIGAGYALLGERDKAMDWLEVAVSRGFLIGRVFETHDPFLAGLRGEPRFSALIGEMRRRSDAFSVDTSPSPPFPPGGRD